MRIAWIATALAAPAGAAEHVWQGSLRLELLSLPPVEVEGGGVAVVNDATAGIALRTLVLAGGITGSAATPVTDPEVTASGLVALGVEATLGSGTLAPFGSSLPPGQPLLTANVLPVAGLARVCFIVSPCPGGFALGLTASGGTRGLGVGGLITAGGFGPDRVSVEAAPWTLGTASLALETPSGSPFTLVTSGWVHGPLSFTGSTALPGGALSVVTPLRVTAGELALFNGFARLEVRFVPEPGRLLLLTSGLIGLAWIGRGRMRR